VVPRVADLGKALRTGSNLQKLEAIEAAARLGAHAAALVPDLAALVSSDEYVPCTSRDYSWATHALIGEGAARAIAAIGVAPDVATLRALLGDHRVLHFPQACFDQGAYIGDYASETRSPAALAARLVPLMGASGLSLLPELAANLHSDTDEISSAASMAIADLAAKLEHADARLVADLRGEAEIMAASPEAIAPTTRRGFRLRDLAALCQKKLAALDS
jgi:hypothetical protein